MRLTRSVGYAVAILLRVATEEDGASLTAARIAKGSRFPRRFLYRILRRLVSAGLLEGTSGPRGGYRLARRARQISLWDIVVAVEGETPPDRLHVVNRRSRGAVVLVNGLSKRLWLSARTAMRRLTLARLARGK